MNDEQLLRYSRQIMLPDVDVAGQDKLLNARVLIIGLGGLGSPVSMYLAAAGVGHLVLADFDEVDITNLQRQIAHSGADVGRPKVDSARDTLLAFNPDIQVTAINQALEGEELSEQVRLADAVVDCTDNFAIRFALNEACVAHKTPLISGAAIRLEGQVAVYDSRNEDSPCYRCLYQEGDEESLTCSESGVIAPLVGMIGATQALETMKASQAAGHVAKLTGLDRKTLYNRAMEIKAG